MMSVREDTAQLGEPEGSVATKVHSRHWQLRRR
jgi:hypothetical protein